MKRVMDSRYLDRNIPIHVVLKYQGGAETTLYDEFEHIYVCKPGKSRSSVGQYSAIVTPNLFEGFDKVLVPGRLDGIRDLKTCEVRSCPHPFLPPYSVAG